MAGISLLLWHFVAPGQRKSMALLMKSAGLFILPVSVTYLLPFSHVFGSMWVPIGIAVEETLKTVAALTERDLRDRFRLISLFGIWEAMLAKPVWAIVNAQSFSEWSDWGIVYITLTTTVVILMHAATAAIYSSASRKRVLFSFCVCYSIHLLYNTFVTIQNAVLFAAFFSLIVYKLGPRDECLPQ